MENEPKFVVTYKCGDCRSNWDHPVDSIQSAIYLICEIRCPKNCLPNDNIQIIRHRFISEAELSEWRRSYGDVQKSKNPAVIGGY